MPDLSAVWDYSSLPRDHGLVRVDASESHGPIAEYVWAWGDGSSDATTSPVAEHQYSQNGIYNVTLCVTEVPGICFQSGAKADYRERTVIVKGVKGKKAE